MKKILISVTEENLKKLDNFKEWRFKEKGYKESRSAIIAILIKNQLRGF